MNKHADFLHEEGKVALRLSLLIPIDLWWLGFFVWFWCVFVVGFCLLVGFFLLLMQNSSQLM